MKILVVVDMQNDFITGKLGSEDAASIIDKVVDKIKKFDGEILFTRDTHTKNYLQTQEGKNLPVEHCILGTSGHELCPKIKELCKTKPFDKPCFGSIELSNYLLNQNKKSPIESVTIIGLCTDICVISNAFLLKAFLPETKIIVDKNCCAGVTKQSHEVALEAMKNCQIIIK